ncbi:MAG: hypothetical protein V1772_14360, partial [Chloroflexota bacterium]
MSGAEDATLKEQEAAAAPEPTASDGRDLTRLALDEVVRPLAVAAMLTCLAISLAQAVAAFEVRWAGRAFAVLVFVVALESIHARRYLERVRMDSRDRLRFRFVEWVVLTLAARFFPYAELGGQKLVADLARWSGSMATLFDFGFLAHVVLVAIFWGLAYALSQALDELEATPLERPVAVTDPGYYLRSTMPQQGRVDRQSRVNRIVGLFFAGGVFILLLAAAARVNVQVFITFKHPRSTGIILNVLAYFVIGFFLISQARYTVLKANWELQNIPVMGNMARRWLLLVAGFLIAVGLISAVLPVSYSVGIIDAIGTAVRWLVYVLVQIAFFVLFAISYVIGLVLSLFTGKPASATPNMARPVAPPMPPAVPGEPNPWWQLIRSLLFWTALFGIVGYSLFQFLVYRLHLLENVRLQRFLGWLQRL